MKCLIFDIREFSLHDGGGIRTTVFFKGCPLRCIWCHNPEGLEPKREIYATEKGCLKCGLCRKPCGHTECRELGRCVHICPRGLVRVSGEEYEVGELAQKLLRQADLYGQCGGGITFSGGEPLMQPDFVCELSELLTGVDRTLETSGFAPAEVFDRVISRCDFVYMDIKLFDSAQHKRFTGVDNALILANAERLKHSGIPHVFRVPLIPGITDTPENLSAIGKFIGDDKTELLKYNKFAPVKYPGTGRTFTHLIHPENAAEPDLSHFRNAVVVD